MTLGRHTRSVRLAQSTVLSVVCALSLAATEATAATVTDQVSSSSARAASNVGAGQNSPRFNDWHARYWYTCPAQGIFKVTNAKIVMWSKGGNRVKGFQFKYRIVPQGTDGQPVPFSNWSDNVSTSFDQGTVHSIWMTAGSQGQSWSSAAAWDMEIKLKYPRSLRTAYRFKYRKAIPSPDCG